MGRALLIVLLATGCSSSATTAGFLVPDQSPQRARKSNRKAKKPAKPQVMVKGVRAGEALHIQVVAKAERSANSAFEKSRNWTVYAKSGGRTLAKVLNGSTRVVRTTTHARDRWDVTVTFDAAFRLPSRLTKSEVWVRAPGERPKRFIIANL
jgi:hypothetical protein